MGETCLEINKLVHYKTHEHSPFTKYLHSHIEVNVNTKLQLLYPLPAEKQTSCRMIFQILIISNVIYDRRSSP